MLEQIVKSKYFHKSGMDESSTDFEEKKNICTGPKAFKKSNVKRHKPKRRIKGQKDIRTLIKQNKNDILTFTKDFNDVCVQGGIDVDSQQLQLAIALSKSLQQSEQVKGGDLPSSKILSSQERTNRIRRTLQEYGFKIPETKIKLDSYNKRAKKYRKSYKLLQLSEEEKQQKICNRYSQVLFENPDKSFEKDVSDCNTGSKLYNLATNTTYELLKNNEIFYILEILVEISLSKVNLLRDWSDIPGRPVSPKLVEEFVISMSEIQCSQSELDIILSGKLNTVKDVFKTKLNNKAYCETKFQVNSFNNPELNITSVQNSPTEPSNKSILNQELKSGEVNLSIMSSLQLNRSNSPDIFDDELSLINNSINKTHQNVENITRSKSVDANISILELTESSEAINNINSFKPSSQPSCNMTKRKSNDFMDLTECVPMMSHYRSKLISPLNKKDELIHNDCMEFTKCVNPILQESYAINNHIQNDVKEDITNESLTVENDVMEFKNKANSHDLPSADISNDEGNILECSSDDTIIINDNYIDLTQNCHNNSAIFKDSLKMGGNVEMMDLTQSSDEELPAVHIPGTQKSPDDIMIVNKDVNALLTQTKINVMILCPKSNKQEVNADFHVTGNVNTAEINEDTVLDISDDLLPGNPNSDVEIGPNSVQSSHNKTQCEASPQVDNQSINVENVDMENENIDLTQSSESTIEDYQEYSQSGNTIENLEFNGYNVLGKISDISIDYDEIASDSAVSVSKINGKHQNVQTNTPTSNGSMKLSKKDNISENFELSDKGLNYSLYKSKVDIDFEGSSILDDIPNVYKSNNRTYRDYYTTNRSQSESDVPAVSGNDHTSINDRGKHFNVTLSKSTCSTPIKAIVSDNIVSIRTPANTEYVVKTGEITPMLDYAAMSSPERNKELERYGLKPFKRKRAIQLLTHLYNQTHPIIEQCSEDPVPLKKHKPSFTKKSSENDTNKTYIDSDKENIYTESTYVPEIRDIDCGSDDWVFQKREKAKVHSCSVPLHIAFHNYVSCRRRLREAILRYEPINIDVVHKDLVSYGYKYNPKDLLKFLDRKCITVKTADNNARNNK